MLKVMNSETATSQGSEMEDQIKTYEQFCDFWGFDMNDDYQDIHNSYLLEAEKSFFSPSPEEDLM